MTGTKASHGKIFFPNLDGLRFFSFFLVFCAHIFATKYDSIKQETWFHLFKGKLFSDGDIGVSFFFVLSGFLITYLLLKEKELTGRIHVPAFYLRRTLRIWPLYYFCVFFGFVIFPFLKAHLGETPNETASPILCSTFLNNFNEIKNGLPDASVLGVLWSVAIEEQFYLVWPLLFLVVPKKFYGFIFAAVIISSLVFRATHIGEEIDIHTLGVISDMAMGGLAAWLVLNRKGFLLSVEKVNPFLNLIPWLTALAFICFKQEIFSVPVTIAAKRIMLSFFFAWIILEQNFGRSCFKIGRLKTISQLGKYTYGLYCLHPVMILVTMTLLAKLGLDRTSWQLWLFEFPMAMLLSVGASYISYRFFESRFLKLKKKFAFITQD